MSYELQSRTPFLLIRRYFIFGDAWNNTSGKQTRIRGQM